jgi:quinol monooxygenase YgiN
MFLSWIRIVPVPEKRDGILEMLATAARHVKLLRDCRGGTVCEERGNGNAILYLESWGSREALQRHVRSDLYRSVLHALDLAAEPPEVFFFEISGENGMELIRELRE